MSRGPEPIAGVAVEARADEGEEESRHEDSCEEDPAGDEGAELGESWGLATEEAEEADGGGERPKKDTFALGADGGGDGGFVGGAGFAGALVDGVEHHPEIDAEADEDGAEADGDHIEFVEEEGAGGDGEEAAEGEDFEDGEEWGEAAEPEIENEGDEEDGTGDGGDDIGAHGEGEFADIRGAAGDEDLGSGTGPTLEHPFLEVSDLGHGDLASAGAEIELGGFGEDDSERAVWGGEWASLVDGERACEGFESRGDEAEGIEIEFDFGFGRAGGEGIAEFFEAEGDVIGAGGEESEIESGVVEVEE